MFRRALASSLLPTALLVGGLTAGTTSASAADPLPPVTIMINGDSITQGFNGDYTWRYRFWGTLTQQVAKGARTFDLVGPYQLPFALPGIPSYYRGGTAWDKDHDSVGASTLANHADTAYDLLGHVQQFEPDVLITYLGTNDLLAAMDEYSRSTLPESQKRPAFENKIDTAVLTYANLIGQVQEARPGIKIVVGEVMSRAIAPWARERFNSALAAFADAATTPESTEPVLVADLDNPEDQAKWGSSTYTSDLVHPTPSGEMVIAQKFAEQVYEAQPDLFVTPPNIPQIFVPWNPTLAPTIVVRSRRILLSSGPTMRKNGVLAMRVKLYSVKTKRTAVGSFAASVSWRSLVLAPGYYRVQMQGLRKNMISAWSKSYTVKVPSPPKRKKRR